MAGEGAGGSFGLIRGHAAADIGTFLEFPLISEIILLTLHGGEYEEFARAGSAKILGIGS
jgi:hypothetical protein